MAENSTNQDSRQGDEPGTDRASVEIGTTLEEVLGETPDPSEQLAEEQDRVLRLQAEMQNLRARTTREIAEERRYGALPLMRDLLPVVDNVDRAIEAAEKNSDAESLLERNCPARILGANR